MKPLLVLFFAVLSSSFSQAASECTEILTREGEFQINRFEASDGDCFFGVDPSNVPASFVYRSFLFMDDGLFMVFNSYSTSGSPSATGARVFYLFPRVLTPKYTVNSSQFKVSTSAPGIEILFHKNKPRIAGMNGGVIKESSKVSPSNSGGVELSNMKTLYLDVGFRQGQDPSTDPNRSSTFVDSRGQKCALKNHELFKYFSDGDTEFLFSDQELKKFLGQRCPNLKVNF